MRAKGFFTRGLAGLLPAMLTIFILVTGFRFLDQYIGVPITQTVAENFGGQISEKIAEHPWIRSIVTITISTLLVFIVGFILATFTGRRVYSHFEQLLFDLPVVRKIYPSTKQLTEFFFKDQQKDWSTVVAIQYPRQGMWSIGFLMGDAPGELSAQSKEKLVSVYAPTSPMPFTGYVVCLPASEVVQLEISVEDAFHFIVSAGVVIPSQRGSNSRISHT